jgi:lysozyme
MQTSEKGLNLIKSFEKCKLVAFKPTPNDVWTVGWGHTGHDVDQHTICTQVQADAWLANDVGTAERCISGVVTAELLQTEFDALVSLCYNIGCMHFKDSTLVKLINAGDYDGAAEQFKRWNKQAGQELAGLTVRREAEQKLFEDVT